MRSTCSDSQPLLSLETAWRNFGFSCCENRNSDLQLLILLTLLNSWLSWTPVTPDPPELLTLQTLLTFLIFLALLNSWPSWPSWIPEGLALLNAWPSWPPDPPANISRCWNYRCAIVPGFSLRFEVFFKDLRIVSFRLSRAYFIFITCHEY